MFGGHNAKRKFGGPEMYAVASRALIAGDEDGKRYAKSLVVRDVVAGVDATLCAARDWTK